jgi:hypothetical protein
MATSTVLVTQTSLVQSILLKPVLWNVKRFKVAFVWVNDLVAPIGDWIALDCQEASRKKLGYSQVNEIRRELVWIANTFSVVNFPQIVSLGIDSDWHEIRTNPDQPIVRLSLTLHSDAALVVGPAFRLVWRFTFEHVTPDSVFA